MWSLQNFNLRWLNLHYIVTVTQADIKNIGKFIIARSRITAIKTK